MKELRQRSSSNEFRFALMQQFSVESVDDGWDDGRLLYLFGVMARPPRSYALVLLVAASYWS